MSDPSNFLLFVADQLRSDAVGAFGNTVVQTPRLDALAARGTTFTNAFAQFPACTPSRASFMTGWYPHVAGHRTLTHLLRPHEPNLLRTLRTSGYNVAWIGDRGDTLAPGVTEASTDFCGFDDPPPGPFPDATLEAPPDPRLSDAFYGGGSSRPSPERTSCRYGPPSGGCVSIPANRGSCSSRRYSRTPRSRSSNRGSRCTIGGR